MRLKWPPPATCRPPPATYRPSAAPLPAATAATLQQGSRAEKTKADEHLQLGLYEKGPFKSESRESAQSAHTLEYLGGGMYQLQGETPWKIKAQDGMLEVGRCLLSWQKQQKQKTTNANGNGCGIVIPPFPTSGEAGKWAPGTFDFDTARIAGFFFLFPFSSPSNSLCILCVG